MKKTLLLIVMLLSMIVQAQKRFQKGFYVDNQNVKHECFIKNNNWFNSPEMIEIKTDSLSKTTSEISIDRMKEFVINGKVKYIRYKKNEIFDNNIINNYKLPTFNYVMLKELVLGNPSLYSLQDTRVYFFSKKEGENPQFLEYFNGNETIFNEFTSNDNYKIKIINDFGIIQPEDIKKIEKLQYYDQELIAFFNYLNKNKNENFVVVENNTSEDNSEISLIARIGYRRSNFKYTYFNPSTNKVMFVDEFQNTAPRFGFLIGFRPSIANKKILIFADINYSNEKFIGYGEDDRNYKVEFSHIQVPIGLSYSLIRKKDFDLFLSSAFVLDVISRKSFADINRFNIDGHLETGSNFEVGLGCGFKRFNIEVKNGFKKTLTPGKTTINFEHNYLDFILGYKLF